jgi:hypothetical protein
MDVAVHIHHLRYTLSRTLKGSLAFPIGEPFEESFLVSGKTILGSMSKLFPKEFFMEPQIFLPGTKNGSFYL